jgi:hypothetical protein
MKPEPAKRNNTILTEWLQSPAERRLRQICTIGSITVWFDFLRPQSSQSELNSTFLRIALRAQTSSEAHPASYPMGPFPGRVKGGRGVTLTTHPICVNVKND